MSICLRSVYVLLVLIAPLYARAQTIGLEFGGTFDHEIGTINTECGCSFDSGSGMGYHAAFVAEQSLGAGIVAGIKTGYDVKHINSSISITEVAIVQNSEGRTDTAVLDLNRVLDVSISYVGLMPFIEYRVPVVGAFFQLGMITRIPVKSSMKQSRELTNGSAIGLKFQNGTTTENVENEDPISDLNTPQHATIMSVGDEFDLFGTKFMAAIMYDYPLTDVRTSDSWKISSLGAMIGMKVDLK